MPPTQAPEDTPESHQHASTPILPSPSTAPTANLRSQGEFYMTGITPISSESTSDEECTICLEKLTADVVKMGACDHHFHTVCILAWFEKSAPRSGRKKGRCPNCRHELYEPDPRPALQAMPDPRPTPQAMLERQTMLEQQTISQDQLAQFLTAPVMPPLPARPGRPRFHAGGARDSLDVADERHRRRLQTIVRTTAAEPTTNLPNVYYDREQRVQRALGNPGDFDEPRAADPHQPPSPSGPDRLAELRARRQELAARHEELTNRRLRQEAAARAAADMRRMALNTENQENIPPSALSVQDLRLEFERTLRPLGLTAEQLLGSWRRQRPLANDPVEEVSEAPIRRRLRPRPEDSQAGRDAMARLRRENTFEAESLRIPTPGMPGFPTPPAPYSRAYENRAQFNDTDEDSEGVEE